MQLRRPNFRPQAARPDRQHCPDACRTDTSVSHDCHVHSAGRECPAMGVLPASSCATRLQLNHRPGCAACMSVAISGVGRHPAAPVAAWPFEPDMGGPPAKRASGRSLLHSSRLSLKWRCNHDSAAHGPTRSVYFTRGSHQKLPIIPKQKRAGDRIQPRLHGPPSALRN